MKLYQRIAQAHSAMLRTNTHANVARQTIYEAVKELPSGSGFDNGTRYDFAKSTPNRLVFSTAFHHMDEHGCYCGWSHHEVIVTPDLCYDFVTRVTGRNVRGIKEYIEETFNNVLNGHEGEN